MKISRLNAYRSLTKDIDLPLHVKASVTDAAARLRKAEQVAAENSPRSDGAPTTVRHASSPWRTGPSKRKAGPCGTARRTTRRFRLVRGLAAAVCAVALVAGGALATGLIGWPVGSMPQGSGAAAPDASPPSGNFFALAAYADENPAGAPDQTVTLDGKNFGLIHSAGGDGNGTMNVAYAFNLACTGTNIKSVEYAITNSDASFESYSNQDFLKAHGINPDGSYDPPSADGDASPGPSYQVTSAQSLTLDYADQPIDPSKLTCDLHVSFPLTGKTKELNDQLSNTSDNDPRIAESSTQYWDAVQVDAAHALAQARIKLTATFDDGTTQTKTYVIAPVEDFAQRQKAYQKARLEAYAQVGKGQTDAVDKLAPPQLFTITEQTDG